MSKQTLVYSLGMLHGYLMANHAPNELMDLVLELHKLIDERTTVVETSTPEESNNSRPRKRGRPKSQPDYSTENVPNPRR